MSLLEQAELRALVDAAFDLRGGDRRRFREACEAIVAWQVRTLPERLARFARENEGAAA